MRRKPRQPKPPVKETGGLHNEEPGSILEVSDDPRIIERLDRLVDGMNRTASGVEKLVEAIPKPTSLVRRTIETLGLIAGILSLIGVIEIVRNWIRGG